MSVAQKTFLLVLLASAAVHAALGFGVTQIERPAPVRRPVTVKIVEAKKKPAEPPKPKEEPTKPVPPKVAEAPKPPPPPKVVEAPKPPPLPAAPAPAPTPKPGPAKAAKKPAAGAKPSAGRKGPRAPVDLGTYTGDGVGIPQDEPGDDAAAGPEPVAVAPEPEKKKTVERELGPAPKKEKKKPVDDACEEETVKAKPLSIASPSFPESARAAGIEGKVRVEITIDKAGNVVKARVKAGLGHGLDEEALEAAKKGKFEPAMRCGKPVESTLTIGIRFAL